MVSLQRVSLILHKPRSLDNVGAVARIVKNFGLGRLWLVEPLSYSFDRALKLAVGAADVVEGLFVERDLGTALNGFELTIGTSSRTLRGRRSLLPAEVADRVAATAGPVGLLFGEEKRGLSDDELSLCQEICRIPSLEPQPSLNLAQACAVMAYAISAPHAVEAPRAEGVTQAELRALRLRLREVLAPAEFLNPQNPERILDELMRPLERGRLSAREWELWQNALRKVSATLARPRS